MFTQVSDPGLVGLLLIYL